MSLLQTTKTTIETPSATAPAEPFAALRSLRNRRWLYALFSVVGFVSCVLIAIGRMAAFHTTFNIASGDGKDYYVYLPSVMVDHDLDLSNQMREHYGREIEPRLINS